MSHPFDSHRYVKRIAAAGMSPEEAEAHADALAEIMSDALATKADVATLDAKLAELRSDLRREIAESKADILKWVIGIGFGQIAALVGLVYALLKLFPGGRP